MGLNFAPISARRITIECGAAIARSIAGEAKIVAVFVDPERSAVDSVIEQVGVDYLQFHGGETPEFCASFDRPFIKAAGVGDDFDFEGFAARYQSAAALLLDAFAPRQAGGTGRQFDWSQWPRDTERTLILSGGLGVANVGAAIAQTAARIVDVASGVESTTDKRQKDPAKIQAFIQEAQRAVR